MSPPIVTTSRESRPESVAATVARNIVVARLVADLTQHRLAAAADVSRATIAQIETGVCDPRLSTVSDLARALGVPPAFLLLGKAEVQALIALAQWLDVEGLPPIPPDQVRRMQQLVDSGLIRDWKKAARIGAQSVESAGLSGAAAQVLAALFSAVHPGEGTAVGAVLGGAVASTAPKPPRLAGSAGTAG